MKNVFLSREVPVTCSHTSNFFASILATLCHATTINTTTIKNKNVAPNLPDPTIISSPATPIIPTLAPFDQHLDDTDNTLSSDTYSSSVPTEQIAIVNDEQDVVEQVTEEEVQGNTHPLTTRSKDGIHKPNPRYSLASKFETQEPKSINDALKHPGWNNAVNDEMRTLHMLHTWTQVRPTEDRNIFGCKWVFKTKFKPDETVEKLKARLVAK